LPALPSVTALMRSLPAEVDELERRREAFARVRAPRRPPRPPPHDPRDDDRSRRFAAAGIAWALLVLAVVGWAVVTFAARLSDLAASVVGFRSR
jgi:hypothetical protein